MSEETDSESNLTQNDSFPVVFLRHKLGIKSEDRYMIDMALALKNFGHRVTFFTTKLDNLECFEEIDPIRGCLPVLHSGWWIPDSILGMFRRTMVFLKSLWLVMRMIFVPPAPKPKVIILDVHPLGLTFLKVLSKYRTIFIQHFPMIQALDISEYRHLNPRYEVANALNHATEIIVQTSCLAQVFRHLYPNCKKQLRILCPCVDVGLWNEPSANLSRIIPDLPRNAIMFVVFGDYRKRSNFKLALDSLEYLLRMLEDPIKEDIHMIIAGHCSEKSNEQLQYYQELVEVTSEKSYGAQVTFLRQLPTLHKKTLIENCVAVVHPVKNDLYPGPLLAAMSLGKPVIAVNSGFPSEIVTHRISGILVDPLPEKFAAAMYKLATKPIVQHFIGQMAKDTFRSHFTFQNFSRKLHSVVTNSRKLSIDNM
ncbi:alpha-1,3/1,6-mannosyltransferase ALG2-like isoform X2 [Agrilus planipennis]|uniref:Alpha-1,3/1,6-mannosyltransferase ALG2 n=1 Tax=Agrilus planipennis TaxID=224129 RepID=A0A1W4XDQ1_AGRPL|nr:alpha-1,3/1,6-mannosyltransferase ALG2-like isoform X1 [Agrilus planipennis]XP_025836397.1 alpha-1,3/1,6-mannosyltransferase ALG2-like isoform X2 [Agrilus planipennis]